MPKLAGLSNFSIANPYKNAIALAKIGKMENVFWGYPGEKFVG
jgi:hypothetical protein